MPPRIPIPRLLGWATTGAGYVGLVTGDCHRPWDRPPGPAAWPPQVNIAVPRAGL